MDELKQWPDCPKWARASEGPGWLIVFIYGGGLLWLFIGLLWQGRLHTLFEEPHGPRIFAIVWGIFSVLAGTWLIVTVRRARRIMARIHARRESYNV